MSEQVEEKKSEQKTEEKVEVKKPFKPIKERTKDFIFEDMALIKIGEEYGFAPENSVRIAVADKKVEVVNPETQEKEEVSVIHAVSVSKEKLEHLRDGLQGPFRLDGHVVKTIRPDADIISDYLELVPLSPENLRKKLEDLEGKVEKWKEETKA